MGPPSRRRPLVRPLLGGRLAPLRRLAGFLRPRLLKMHIEFGDAFDYSGADFHKWCGEVGFERLEVIHLAARTARRWLTSEAAQLWGGKLRSRSSRKLRLTRTVNGRKSAAMNIIHVLSPSCGASPKVYP